MQYRYNNTFPSDHIFSHDDMVVTYLRLYIARSLVDCFSRSSSASSCATLAAWSSARLLASRSSASTPALAFCSRYHSEKPPAPAMYPGTPASADASKPSTEEASKAFTLMLSRHRDDAGLFGTTNAPRGAGVEERGCNLNDVDSIC